MGLVVVCGGSGRYIMSTVLCDDCFRGTSDTVDHATMTSYINSAAGTNAASCLTQLQSVRGRPRQPPRPAPRVFPWVLCVRACVRACNTCVACLHPAATRVPGCLRGLVGRL
jgi:hypothetical protein